jgi:hypothetical protein
MFYKCQALFLSWKKQHEEIRTKITHHWVMELTWYLGETHNKHAYIHIPTYIHSMLEYDKML